MAGFWEADALAEPAAPAAPKGNGFWEADALADAAPSPVATAPAATDADRAITALTPFFEKGVSTRNSAGQWTGEARALLSKAGVNPDAIDHKAEKSLLATYEGRNQPAGDEAAAVGRGLINGIPIAGPYALSGVNKAAAFVRSVQNGTSYSDELKNVENFGKRTADANPISTTAGEVGGGVLGTAPLVAAAPAAFGAGAGGLVLRSGASAASGALLGLGDAAVRSGGDGMETLKGGGIGLVAGGLGPGAGKLVGKGVNATLGALAERRVAVPGAGKQAAAKLADDLRTSGGADAVRARLEELGPEAMLLDASPSFVGRAQGLAVQPETRATITAPLETRNLGTNQRVRAGLDEALGEAPVPSQVEAQFAAKRKEAGPLFERALGEAGPVDASDALSEIAQRLNTAAGSEKAALLRARELLTEEGANGGLVPRSDPRYLANAKQELDKLIDYGDPTIGVARGSLSKNDGALAAVRQQLNGALEAQVPGYADANLAYRTAARASEALESGKRVLGGGDAAIHPEDFVRDLNGRPIEQQAALRAGVRADLDRAVGNSANDLQALRKQFLEDPDWNRQKLNAAFGNEPVADVARTIDANQTFRDHYADIVKNSQTQQRAAAAADMAVREIMPKGGVSGVALAGAAGGPTGTALALGGKGAKIAANAAGRASDLARNRETAAILTMKAGPERDALIDALNARLEAASRGEAVASQMDKFVRQVLQSQNDRREPLQIRARAGRQ